MNWSRLQLFFVFILLLGCAGLVRSFPADLKPCASDPTILCGTYRVFEDREKRSGRTIDLNVVVLPSVGARKFNPMFDIQGGPGVAATNDVELFVKFVPQYRRGRDIVLVDQRGTGASNPLRCERLPGNTPLDEMYPVEYVRRCRQALEEKADLTKYTTEIAMDDLDDVRRWLGYNKIDIWALSYGTRAAQVYARQHPEAVGHMALTGVIGTYHKMPFYHSVNAQASLDLLLGECDRDPSCHQAFPNLQREVPQLFASLRREPARVSYSGVIYTIHPEIFAEQVRKWLYTRDTSQQIPFVLHSAATGHFQPFLRRVLGKRLSDVPDLIADGMYLSVTCAEDVPFIDVDEAARQDSKTIFGNYRVGQQKRACSEWRRGTISKHYRDPVVSSLPTMFITGSFDPVTSPKWADELARGFTSHLMITVPEQGHGPIGLTNIDCEDDLMIRFMSDLPITDSDKACLAAMKPPPFVTTDPKQ